MTKSNIIWGLIFGFLSSVTYFHFVSNDSVYQSEKLFKYVGFVDYSEDVISHEQLMKLIEENYQRIPKCNYGVAIVKTPETAANIGLSILSSKFGEEFVDAQKPFRVYLLNGKVWMLQGNVADNKGSVILIQKFDGTILSIKNNKIMNGKKHYLFLIISIVVGCCFGYAFHIKYDHTQIKAYCYQGLKSCNLKLPVVNGFYKPDSSVWNLEGGVLSDFKVVGEVGFMILKDIYGYDKIYKQKPFLIEKDFESWTVSGSGEDFSPYQLGGVSYIVIDRKTGMVIDFSFEK